MRSTCTSHRSSSAPASASMTTRLTTGSSGFTGSATAIPLRRSTCGTDPSLPVGPQPALRARPVVGRARYGADMQCRINEAVVHFDQQGSGVPAIALHGGDVSHRELEVAL